MHGLKCQCVWLYNGTVPWFIHGDTMWLNAYSVRHKIKWAVVRFPLQFMCRNVGQIYLIFTLSSVHPAVIGYRVEWGKMQNCSDSLQLQKLRWILPGGDKTVKECVPVCWNHRNIGTVNMYIYIYILGCLLVRNFNCKWMNSYRPFQLIDT